MFSDVMLVLGGAVGNNTGMTSIVSRRRIIVGIGLLVLLAIGMFGILPRLNSFGGGLDALRQAQPAYVAGALAAVFASYIFSALTYQALSFKRLIFRTTFTVELAGLLVNRVLPGGIGGLGMNYAYLRTRHHTAVQAASIVTLNNCLGFVGHILLALLIVTLRPAEISKLHISLKSQTIELLGLVIGIGIILILIVGFKRKWFESSRAKALHSQLKAVLSRYRRRPLRPLLALAMSMLMTLANVICLWLCSRAIGLPLDFLAIFIIFTFGVLIGTATPTPGGLGGIETALIAGFVAIHTTAQTAFAAVLLYRLVSFWLELLIGLLALIVVQSKRLIIWQF